MNRLNQKANEDHSEGVDFPDKLDDADINISFGVLCKVYSTTSSWTYIDPVWFRKYVDEENIEEFLNHIKMKELFSKKYVFVPVCLRDHWNLLLICNLCEELKNPKKSPCIIYLDSLKTSDPEKFRPIIQRFLMDIYQLDDKKASKHQILKIPLLAPKIPFQSDDKQSGYFVVYYAKLFLKSCPESFSISDGYPYLMTRDWFTIESFSYFSWRMASCKRNKYVRKQIFGGSKLVKEKIDNQSENLVVSKPYNKRSWKTTSFSEESLNSEDDQKHNDTVVKKVKNLDSRERTSIYQDFVDVENDDHESSTLYVKRLLMKLRPILLCDVIKGFSDAQKKWIEETGFGKLLLFQMKSFPRALGYYLVSKFDSSSCSLVFDGVRIPIEEKDVHEILGLPMGRKKVVVVKNDNVVKTWIMQYPHLIVPRKVPATYVADVISRSVEVDTNFKFNFLLLMSSIIIHAPTNTYVRQSLLGFTGDLNNLKDYNWCAYLIDCLKLAKKDWFKNPGIIHFSGSLSFLVYFYINHITNIDRTKKPSFPRFVAFDDSFIMKYQDFLLSKGDYGMLMFVDPIVAKKVNDYLINEY